LPTSRHGSRLSVRVGLPTFEKFVRTNFRCRSVSGVLLDDCRVKSCQVEAPP
jgi:hypothetical protein